MQVRNHERRFKLLDVCPGAVACQALAVLKGSGRVSVKVNIRIMFMLMLGLRLELV